MAVPSIVEIVEKGKQDLKMRRQGRAHVQRPPHELAQSAIEILEGNPILKRRLIDRYHILYCDANGKERSDIDIEHEKPDGAFGTKLDEMLRRLRFIFPLGDTEKSKMKRLDLYKKRDLLIKKKNKELKRWRAKRPSSACVDLTVDT